MMCETIKSAWCVLFFSLVCMWTADKVQGTGDPIQALDAGEAADYEITHAMPWVSKCCNLTYGFSFENKSSCEETEDEFLLDFEDWPDYSEKAKDLPVHARYEYFITDDLCLDGKYILDQTEYPDDKYSIYSNGTLLYLDHIYNMSDFCVETVNNTVRVFICFEAVQIDYELDFTFVLYAIGLLISIPFLLATAAIYLGIDMLRDLRGKSLACHVLCLACGYLFLAIVQLRSKHLVQDICIAAGFIIQFFFVAAFFWLNVICYDTWHYISRDCRSVYDSKNPEKKTFLLYSLYAWQGTMILSIISLVMDLGPAIPESYVKPNFGLKSCWFYSDDAALPYFYGPIGIIILVNIIFFILSAIKIYKEQKKGVDIMLKDTRSNDKTREKSSSIRRYIKTLQECFYLFGIMGINWAAEIISWAIGGSQIIWVITDLFNTLQGVMIFYLFVIKQTEVRDEVKRKFIKTWANCKSSEERNYFRMRQLGNSKKEFHGLSNEEKFL